MNALTPVIPLEKSGAEPLAYVLSRIFAEVPPFPYLIPNARERRTTLPGLFGCAIRSAKAHGETYTTHNLEGGSLWISPDRNLTIDRVLRTKSPIDLKLSWSILKRCVILGRRMQEIRNRLAKRPHWYLLALGVKSSPQENVLKEALIEPVLSQADSLAVPCYVEVFHEGHLPFYRDRGFRIEGSGRIPGRGPDFWAMIREPR